MKKFFAILAAALLLFSFTVAEETAMVNFSGIRINEFMASNGKTLKDSLGESPDWIELYNDDDADINLEGLCLSDSKKDLEKFVFPSIILPAHGYIVIFADDLDVILDDEIHVAFKLSADGEKVVLSYQGVILDIVSFDAQEKDVSYARYDSRSWRFTETPTPGAENVFTE